MAKAKNGRGPSWRDIGRFMESLLLLLRRYWDHEPTPNPSQEGNRQDADGCLLPSWEGSGVGGSMERERSALTGGIARAFSFASRPDRRAVPAADRFPIMRPVGLVDGVLCGRLFVEVHAPARRFVDVGVAAFDRGTAGKDFLSSVVERDDFLNPE